MAHDGIVIAVALFLGYGIGRYRQHKYRYRCESLCEWSFTDTNIDQITQTAILRCDQDHGHSGPHSARHNWKRQWWYGDGNAEESGD